MDALYVIQDYCASLADSLIYTCLNDPEVWTIDPEVKENGLISYVERVDRFQFTASLKNDKTNWRISKYRLYGYKDLYIKYPDEFVISIENLLNKNNVLFKQFRLICNYYYICLRRYFGKLKSKT